MCPGVLCPSQPTGTNSSPSDSSCLPSLPWLRHLPLFFVSPGLCFFSFSLLLLIHWSVLRTLSFYQSCLSLRSGSVANQGLWYQDVPIKAVAIWEISQTRTHGQATSYPSHGLRMGWKRGVSPPHNMWQLQKPHEKLLSATQSCGYKTDGQVKKETDQATISHWSIFPLHYSWCQDHLTDNKGLSFTWIFFPLDQPVQWPEKQALPGSLSGDLHSISNALRHPAPPSPSLCSTSNQMENWHSIKKCNSQKTLNVLYTRWLYNSLSRSTKEK